MSEQALLPIYQALPALGRPSLDESPSRESSHTEYRPIVVGTLLNRCLSSRLPFAWTINPYRGCEFGCTYCYARYTHRFFDLGRWQDFERKVFFKRQASRTLAQELKRRDLHGQPIAIGTATDPYQPAERHYGITRSLLETLSVAEDLDLSITTKSPLILRDLDLLAALDRRHSLTVQVTITTLDPGLARRLEQRAPDPDARLRVVRELSAAGIRSQVFCMPLMPGINDREDTLSSLLAAAGDAGADDVIASPLFLRSSTRDRFLPWLRSEFPDLEPMYRRLYRRRDYLSADDRERLMLNFRHLRMLYGFPRTRPGRG